MSVPTFLFFVLVAAMAAYWHTDVCQLVGCVVVSFALAVAGICSMSSPRAWVFGLLQTAAGLVVTPTEDVDFSAIEAESGRNERLRSQVGVLEQQLRGTEARVRDSEIARETEKQRHEKEVRQLDVQLATVSRAIKESLRAKDQVIVECRQWRRKFEDLEYLQHQAQINPVRGIKGRPRWAPAKKYGVGKGERGRPGKKFTAIAQVAIVNAAWESKLVGFESEARDYVARTTDQLRSLHDAATALSNDNAYLRQQIQANPDIPHELAQQQVRDAERRVMEFADQQHEERVNSLKQTYLKELVAAKADYEGKLAKATSEFEAKAETALAQQREVAERAAQEAASLKDQLAAKEAQLGELRTANAEIADELQARKEAHEQLDDEMQKETDRVVKCVQQRDGYIRAGKKLQAKYDALQAEMIDLASERKGLEDEIQVLNNTIRDLDDTNHQLAEDGERFQQRVEELEGHNRVLLDHNAEVLCQTVTSDMQLQEARDRVSDLEHQVAVFQTAEAADITKAVSGMGFGGAD